MNEFLGFILLWFIVYLIAGRVANPKIAFKCLFGIHYYYIDAGVKHGMFFEEGRGLVGTSRKRYRCECGKYKPYAEEDIQYTRGESNDSN